MLWKAAKEKARFLALQGEARALFRAVDDAGAQVFVTTTHEGSLPRVGDARVVTVRADAIS